MPDNPELEFVKARLQELRAKLTNAETALGIPVTADTAADLVAGIAGALRRSGNGALAERYASAFDRFDKADLAARRILETVEVNEAINAAMNEALEDFERVEADVKAWFESLEEKGGAH